MTARIVFLLLLAIPASALQILDTHRSTYLRIGDCCPPDIQTESTDALGPWSSNIEGPYSQWARQDSLVSDEEISGTGAVRHQYTFDFAETIVDVTFALDVETAFIFSVVPQAYYLNEVAQGPRGRVTLANDSGALLYDVNLQRDQYGYGHGLEASGVLEPGIYRLLYRFWDPGSHNYSASSPTSFSFVVPEPATAAMVLIGLVVMARWRIHVAR